MIQTIDVQGDELLTREQVARLLNVAPHTLACWRCAQKGPPMVKFGRGRSAACRYRRSAVDAWVAEHEGAEAQARPTRAKSIRTRHATPKRSRAR
jgi:hypothetical protein